MTNAISAGSGVPPIDWPARPATSIPVASAPAVRPDPQVRAQAAARLLQQYLQESGHEMKFVVDKVTGKTIVRIYNRASGELVRQIPSEEIVRIAELLRQEIRSPVVNVRA